MAFEDWSENPDENTDINGIDIAELCLPSGINDAIRNVMSDLKKLSFFRNITFARDFGVKGDGTTDDTEALQNFFAAGGNGKLLYLHNGSFLFKSNLEILPGTIMLVAQDSEFVPDWVASGEARAIPLIKAGEDCYFTYLAFHLKSGINNVRTCLELNSNTYIGMFKADSVDLNNNRTEPGATDNISGAIVLHGENIKVGSININRFDKGITFESCTHVNIDSIKILETVQGIYGTNSTDVTFNRIYVTGPTNPAEPNSFRRGIMTPGANGILLTGVSDSYFNNITMFNILEHGIRIGQVDAASVIQNYRLWFSNIEIQRPYGCGFKTQTDGTETVQQVFITSLRVIDAGNDNWYGTPGYQNWQNGVNDPTLDNDGNKVSCAFRNAYEVYLNGFTSSKRNTSNGGYRGLWCQRSNNVTCIGVVVSDARISGIVVQGAATEDVNDITIKGAKTFNNLQYGLHFVPIGGFNVSWRGVSVTDLDSFDNGLQDIRIETTTFTDRATRVNGFMGGSALITTDVQNSSYFMNEIRSEGTYSPELVVTSIGDMNINYSEQTGRWSRLGKLVFVSLTLSFIPDGSTGSGVIYVTLPFPVPSEVRDDLAVTDINSAFSWASRSQISARTVPRNPWAALITKGESMDQTALRVENMTMGSAHTIRISGWYESTI